MYKRCNSLKERLSDIPNFKHNKCLQQPERNDTHKIKFGNVEFETVNQSCCLRDMVRVKDGAEASLSPKSKLNGRREEI